jgi:ankyrin repeat protein
MMDAGVVFTSDLLLILCRIPDLELICQLLPEAIISYSWYSEETTRIISRFANTISAEITPEENSSGSNAEKDGRCRNAAENVAMARKIAQALTGLPTGVKAQCCEVLVSNSLWPSLAPEDWPYYEGAFAMIVNASNSRTDASQASLLIAAKTRNAGVLHRLLDTNVDCSASALKDLLEEAIVWGNSGAFKRLIHELMFIRGMEQDDLQTYGSSFMKKAILQGNLPSVQETFSAGIGVRFALSDGLVLAIRQRQLDLVEFLLKSGADANEMLHSYSSALSEALSSGSVDIVKLLIRFGANPNDTKTLCVASEQNANILKSFLRACKKDFLAKGGVWMLFDAIKSYEFDTVELLLRHGVNCTLLIDVGPRKTCLAAAIESDHCEMLKLLLETGLDVNSVVEQGSEDIQNAFPHSYTALVKAIQCQNLNAIDMLLEAGAGVNLSNSSGTPVSISPIQTAAEKGDMDLILKLLDLGSNVNEKINEYGGYTALQITASKGLIGIASLLLEHGADVNAKGARKDGRTALEAAAENDRIDMVRFLINSGAHIIGPDGQQYQQAMNLASQRGNFAVCKLLENLYEEQTGGHSSVPEISLEDVDFDFSNENPSFCDFTDEALNFVPTENPSDPNNTMPDIAESVDWAWPSSISDLEVNPDD